MIAKTTNRMSTFRNVLLLSLLFFLVLPTAQLYSVTDIKIKSESTILTKREKQKAIKTNNKVRRKVDKLRKKLEDLRAMEQEEKKGKGLAIAGGIILLIGLILILAGNSSSSSSDLDNAVFGCASVFAGLILSLVGGILLIVGLVV